MRCYFTQAGHIASLEFLDATTDEGRIAEAEKLFAAKATQIKTDGFEVWDGPRFVYRYPSGPN